MQHYKRNFNGQWKQMQNIDFNLYYKNIICYFIYHIMSYYEKYLKYKHKYLELKNIVNLIGNGED